MSLEAEIHLITCRCGKGTYLIVRPPRDIVNDGSFRCRCGTQIKVPYEVLGKRNIILELRK